MKQFSFLVAILFLNYLLAQNYENIAVKEKYDIFNKQIINSYLPCTIDPNNDGNVFGDGLSKILDGYITMYKTTKDKAYLYKFIIQSICVLENRHDYAGINSTPRWVSDPMMYQDSYIIASMAHFVYLVKKEEVDLITLELHPFHKIANNNFGQTFTTFGQFANWLGYRVNETLDWYISNGYWNSVWGFQQTSDAKKAAVINIQAGFATTLLFMGLSDPNFSYMQKANIIAKLIKGNVCFYDPCKDEFYNEPVLRLGNNNSYWWYHSGWSIPLRNCGAGSWWPPNYAYYWNVPNYNGYTQFIEDISHGAIDCWFFINYYYYLPNTTLMETDMIRLHNTYTQNINYSNQVYTGVNRSYDTYIEEGYSSEIINGIKKSSAIAYMPFQYFDNKNLSYGNIYTLIMNYYIENYSICNSQPTFYDGQTNKSHTYIVEAQWQNDCPDLTLYNRKVVYDQDFFSKGILTVAPQEGAGNSYADPEISVPEFTVEPGLTVNMVASKSIVFKSGTHIKSGSNFHAYIDPNLCSNNKSVRINTSANNGKTKTIIMQNSNIDSIAISEYKSELLIFPNPFSECTNIQFSLNEKRTVSLTVTDNYGRMIFKKISNRELEKGIYNIPFSGNNLNNGVYIFTLNIGNNVIITKKIVKQ